MDQQNNFLSAFMCAYVKSIFTRLIGENYNNITTRRINNKLPAYICTFFDIPSINYL